MTLDELRLRIDHVDATLLKLLNERAVLVHEVGDIKKNHGLEIYAPEREEALLQKLVAQSDGILPEKSIRAIYREIMSAALALEQDLKIAYLGPPGTWTHQAALSKFGESVTYLAQPNFDDVFDQVTRRAAEYGVVPIENSTEGAVNHTLDLFADSPLKICAQILLRIDNCLMSEVPKDQIKKLYSHPQVFGQCRQYLSKHFPNVDKIEVSSTTRAAELAKQEPNAAAMGGELAARLHNLPIWDKSIQDRATNTTRFLVIGLKSCPPTGNDRTSLMFSVKDAPGSLYQALMPFNKLHINMSKIESRPSRRRDWEYFFFVDIMGHEKDAVVQHSLCELSEHTSTLKVLGSYPNHLEEATGAPVHSLFSSCQTPHA